MPITFATAADPTLRTPTMQATVAASLMTLGLVDPDRDASAGALWRAISDWGWTDRPGPMCGTVHIRRIALKPVAARRTGTLMIGVELDGEPWRVACDGVPDAEAASLRRLLDLLALNLDEPRLAHGLPFRARAVDPSEWAGRGAGAAIPAALWLTAKTRWTARPQVA